MYLSYHGVDGGQEFSVTRENNTDGMGARHPPDELVRQRLRRIGEGIGKIVYASDHWVVKRVRTPGEIVALIVVWKTVRKFERMLPFGLGARLLDKPSREIRFLRIVAQAAMAVLPKAWWFTTHVREVWRQYHVRSARGERLAREVLEGTPLVPRRVTFPPTRIRVRGWPGWLTVDEATERVEATLDDRLSELAARRDYAGIEEWLMRLLEVRQQGWRLGLFSVDAHLKNFGVTGDRIVLLDTGGVTDRWSEVERKLDLEEVVAQPHVQLGLGRILGGHPRLAARFDARWREIVNREQVRRSWDSAAARSGERKRD